MEPQSHRDGLGNLAALGALALAGVVHLGAWVVADRMPGGDFPGYVAEILATHDALLAHGRVPAWCAGCFGGTTVFTSHLKEVLAFPLAVSVGPLLAAKLLLAMAKLGAAVGMYAVVVRLLGDRRVGAIAGYVYAFGAFANHQNEHLDVVLAAALAPLIFLAATALLGRGGAVRAALLGALVAVQFANNWVHALSVPIAVLLLAGLCPWSAAGAPRPTRRLAARILAAFVLFLAFAASHLAWIGSDARHHRLIPEETTEQVRGLYIERSPFLFVNRENVLGPWLADHHPPGLPVGSWDGGRRYLGVVVLAVCALGAFALRGRERERRLALVAGGLFLFQYWMSLGPRTLLWEVASSFHVSAEAQQIVALVLCSAAVVGLVLAAIASRPGLRLPLPLPRPRCLLATGLVLAFPTFSLWSLAVRALPPIAVQRSPGHYFDTASFPLYLLFAVAATALVRRVTRPAHARLLLAALTLVVVVDFWPSRSRFAGGTPMPPLRQAAAMLEALPGDGGSLRIAQPPVYSPLSSWVVAHASAGHAWGWLPWQAGRSWVDFLQAAAWASEPVASDPRARRLRSDAALLATGRIRYFLLDAQSPRPRELTAPWRLREAGPRFSVWEQPEIVPMALGFHAYRRVNEERHTAAAVSRAARAHRLVVSGQAIGLPAAGGGARASEPPCEVVYHRPRPEHIALELPEGCDPALVFVSEGHHPWWRARVDGEPAPVLRAQMAFLAVPTPPGARRVELRLRRPFAVAAADLLGAGAWTLAAIGAPGLVAFRWRRRRVQTRERAG